MHGRTIGRGAGFVVALAAALAVAASAVPADARARSAIVSIGQTFAPGAVTVHGGELLYLNAGTGEHAVASDVVDADGDPLFWSVVLGVGQADRVHGIEAIQPGTYGFYCPYHETMRGTLVVQAAG